MTTKIYIPPFLLFLLSFLEGGCVMATELTGARVLAPVFGTSLYVWSAVMAITLLGLAGGYFIGGRISSKLHPEKKLMYILILAGIFMMCMPLIAGLMNVFAYRINLLVAVTISSLTVLFPALFLMGMVSPMIIHILINEKKGGGKRSGEVYAVSTLGGILFTFLTGFWLLPSCGNTIPMLFLGGMLMLVPLFYVAKFINTIRSILFFLLAGFIAFINLGNQSKKANVLYTSEGIFGKVEVVDFKRIDPGTKQTEHSRCLLVNNIIQTRMNVDTKKYLQDNVRLIDSNLTGNFKGKKALLLGLGGGSLANLFAEKGFDVTAVEFDKRIYDAAKKYFFLNETVKVVIEDARYYVNRMNGKYDLVMIDLFKGEDTPYHVLTRESISAIKDHISEEGQIIINTYGYLNGETGKGNRAILKTLSACNFNVRVCSTEIAEDKRNIIIYATKKKGRDKTVILTLDKVLAKDYHYEDGDILTDARCNLDYLSAPATMKWRKLYLDNFISSRQ